MSEQIGNENPATSWSWGEFWKEGLLSFKRNRYFVISTVAAFGTSVYLPIFIPSLCGIISVKSFADGRRDKRARTYVKSAAFGALCALSYGMIFKLILDRYDFANAAISQAQKEATIKLFKTPLLEVGDGAEVDFKYPAWDVFGYTIKKRPDTLTAVCLSRFKDPQNRAIVEILYRDQVTGRISFRDFYERSANPAPTPNPDFTPPPLPAEPLVQLTPI